MQLGRIAPFQSLIQIYLDVMLEKLSVKWENIQIFPNFIYKKEKKNLPI